MYFIDSKNLNEKLLNVYDISYFESLLETSNNKIYAYNHTDDIYSERSWFYDYKKDSEIIGILLKIEKLFRNNQSSVDLIIEILATLTNFTNSSKYFRVPDRYLASRSQISRQKLEEILFILSKTKILDLKRIKGINYIKLNLTLLKNDEYLKKKRFQRRFFFRSLRIEEECLEKYNSLYFNDYKESTKLFYTKELIIGITYYWNQLIDKYIINYSEKTNPFYVKRADIKYVEIPIEILKRVLNMSEKKIMSYINKLYKRTDYIAKHGKLYVDTYKNNELLKHFQNAEYKQCDLKKLNEVTLEYGHPTVTPYSAIIFTENFKKSNIGKKILSNKNKYINIIINELKYIKIESILGEDAINTLTELEDIPEEIVKKPELSKALKEELKYYQGINIDKEFGEDCNIINLDKLRRQYYDSIQENRKTLITKLSRISINKISQFDTLKCCKSVKTILEALQSSDDMKLAYRCSSLMNRIIQRLKELKLIYINHQDLYKEFENILAKYELINFIEA